MSAFYLLAVLAIWVQIGKWFWRFWRHIRRKTETKRFSVDAVFITVAIVWLGASFWYSGGRLFYYDAEVKRLCAIDGGVRVYEKVMLPPEKFDRWGQVNFYKPTQGENALGSEYLYLEDWRLLRKGNPELVRSKISIIRRADGFLLGESINYFRRGGAFPGPWHTPAFSCSAPSIEGDVLRQVFHSSKE